MGPAAPGGERGGRPGAELPPMPGVAVLKKIERALSPQVPGHATSGNLSQHLPQTPLTPSSPEPPHASSPRSPLTPFFPQCPSARPDPGIPTAGPAPSSAPQPGSRPAAGVPPATPCKRARPAPPERHTAKGTGREIGAWMWCRPAKGHGCQLGMPCGSWAGCCASVTLLHTVR